MPIYEYRCTSCGHELEALQKLSDAPLTECPACKGATLHKKVSAAGFQLKGSGWYVTDFRNSGAKPAAKGGAKGETKDADNGGGEAKPGDAGKAETTTETTSTKTGGTTETKSTTTTASDKGGA
ncbi:MAG TPA: zinc ribbon domain-containing protein [Casimicrobiaceae bacterium]|jgi:putative FmdB family regulatory protein|nr:zinc ribbon domain-containing protein [Casimicrobiaceae bacterium]HWD17593.1 zinc ribbon domain-containing protein [Casimicrobiaceae bacterium]